MPGLTSLVPVFWLVSRSDSPPDDGEALGLGARARMPGLTSLVPLGASAPSGAAATFRAEMTLVPGDPLAHRALESLLRAEATVRRRLSADLEREGLSATGFSTLVVLTTAGGALQLRTPPHPLRTSKAKATQGGRTLEARRPVEPSPLAPD